jgi:lipoate---protein ligase
MRCIISKSNNSYFNLAAEEYFLKNTTEEIFMLYINRPCIVIGKHQNLLSEINLRYANDKGIKLVRRISGGGAVYQDLHNLNFSFIHNCLNPDHINVTRFTYPILEALKYMGLKVEFSDRNDLVIESKKISGNAMHIFRSRVLSHGTLLFNTDLEHLSSALQNNTQKYTDKSIKSIRSKVVNISKYLDKSISFNQFTANIFENVISGSINPHIQPLDNREENNINQISIEKFNTWDWIYGYSPNYVFQNSFNFSEADVNIELYVEKGIIKRVNMTINPMENAVYYPIFNILDNIRHDYKIIYELLKDNKIINSMPNFNISEFCYHLL